MRRMLIPLAGLALSTIVGCHLTMGICDCDAPTVQPVAATTADLASPVVTATVQPPLSQPMARSEPISDMPRVMPNK